MVEAPIVISALIITEDSARNAASCVESIAKRMFQLLDSRVATHRIEFQPGQEECRAAKGNMFRGAGAKGTSRHGNSKATRDMSRAIASKVMEEGVLPLVLWHIDGDAPWSERSKSRIYADFAAIAAGVRNYLVHGGPRASGISAEEADEKLKRVCLFAPYYSIEAWTFQNLTKLATLSSNANFQRHVKRWKADRALIEEEPKIKDLAPFGSKHNAELASQSFPSAEVYEVGKSYTTTVDSLRVVPGLDEALRITYSYEFQGSTAG